MGSPYTLISWNLTQYFHKTVSVHVWVSREGSSSCRSRSIKTRCVVTWDTFYINTFLDTRMKPANRPSIPYNILCDLLDETFAFISSYFHFAADYYVIWSFISVTETFLHFPRGTFLFQPHPSLPHFSPPLKQLPFSAFFTIHRFHSQERPIFTSTSLHITTKHYISTCNF